MSRGKTGTGVCLFVEPWSSTLGCDSAGPVTPPLSPPSPPHWQGPWKALSSWGGEDRGSISPAKPGTLRRSQGQVAHGLSRGWAPACGGWVRKGPNPFLRLLGCWVLDYLQAMTGPVGSPSHLAGGQWVLELHPDSSRAVWHPQPAHTCCGGQPGRVPPTTGGSRGPGGCRGEEAGIRWQES